MEGWGCHPTVKSSDPKLFLSEGTAGRKMETSMRERNSSDRLNSEMFLSERTAGPKMEKSLRKRRSNGRPKLEANSRRGSKS